MGTINSFLEKPRSVRTLFCLLESNEMGLDEILDAIGGSKTTGMKRISELISLGLVKKQASIKEKRKMLYSLTERGIRFTTELKRILESVDN